MKNRMPRHLNKVADAKRLTSCERIIINHGVSSVADVASTRVEGHTYDMTHGYDYNFVLDIISILLNSIPSTYSEPARASFELYSKFNAELLVKEYKATKSYSEFYEFAGAVDNKYKTKVPYDLIDFRVKYLSGILVTILENEGKYKSSDNAGMLGCAIAACVSEIVYNKATEIGVEYLGRKRAPLRLTKSSPIDPKVFSNIRNHELVHTDSPELYVNIFNKLISIYSNLFENHKDMVEDPFDFIYEEYKLWVETAEIPDNIRDIIELALLCSDRKKKNDKDYKIHTIEYEENTADSAVHNLISRYISAFKEFTLRDLYLHIVSKCMWGYLAETVRVKDEDIKRVSDMLTEARNSEREVGKETKRIKYELRKAQEKIAELSEIDSKLKSSDFVELTKFNEVSRQRTELLRQVESLKSENQELEYKVHSLTSTTFRLEDKDASSEIKELKAENFKLKQQMLHILSEDNNGEEDNIDKDVSDLEYLEVCKKRIEFYGGTPSLHTKLEALFENMVAYDTTKLSIVEEVRNCDFVVVYTKYIGHKIAYCIDNCAKSEGLKIVYVNTTNIRRMIHEIYEQIS